MTVSHALLFVRGGCPIEANQYSENERNTADMKGVYVYEFITEERMMKPATLRPHTTFVKLRSSSTTRSGTRSRIF